MVNLVLLLDIRFGHCAQLSFSKILGPDGAIRVLDPDANIGRQSTP